MRVDSNFKIFSVVHVRDVGQEKSNGVVEDLVQVEGPKKGQKKVPRVQKKGPIQSHYVSAYFT